MSRMTFTQAAERFDFGQDITAHQAIRIVEAYVNLAENVDDTRSRYLVRHAEWIPDNECDGCGEKPQQFTVEQRHPEGGSVLCERCWLQEEGR